MNLIECWSCAKKMSVHDHKGNDGFCAYCGAEIEIDLEYRREHGIFEVGDKVVFGKYPYLYEVIKNFSYIRRKLKVEKTRIKNFGASRHGREISASISSIRHATPEEIKAGHRL